MAERKKFPISVLIVDDEPSIVEQLALILGRRVEVFYTAYNGQEGYECYLREHPDLIISDIDMPTMNGIEFLKMVRADNRHIPFILSTGLKSLDILIEAIEQGITAFLPKPLQIHAMIAKLEEVASLKELELEAKNSTLLLDQYKKVVDDSIIVSKADSNGIITYVNDMFCRVSGYSHDELIGQPHNIVRDPSMPSSLFKELWETIQAKKIWHGIIHNRAKDGSRYTVKSTISAITDSAGNIIEYMALREDVTELLKAQEEAKLAAQIKGDFLANMSHEIRTPMNGILGFTDLLARSNLNEQQTRYLDVIGSSTKTLLRIVNDILDFSKIQSGKLELDCTYINPFVEFDKIVQLFSPIADDKHIKLEVRIDPLLKSGLWIDILRVQQVVSNLLSNAFKFTPENGKVTFYVDSIEQVGDEERIRIGVRDTGIGITAAQQTNIFKAFSQADNSITRQFGGTGLGLTISANLVSLMGGVLNVDSQEGHGSDFYFDINVKTSDTAVETIVLTEKESALQLSGKVLVAEDNDVNQLLMKEYLRQYSVDFTIVSNGREALEALEKDTYSLILMDINMPVMGGIEATDIIKEKGIATPVVALTANAVAGDQERFLEHGFDGYLAKPIVIKELEKIFVMYLSDHPEAKTISEDDEGPKTQLAPLSIVNMTLLNNELDLPDQIIYKLLTLFLNSADSNLLELKTAIDAHDFNRIESIAHKIKGAAGNMRFSPIEKLCEEIEMLARSQNNGDYPKLYQDLEKMMNTVGEEIKTLLMANQENK